MLMLLSDVVCTTQLRIVQVKNIQAFSRVIYGRKFNKNLVKQTALTFLSNLFITIKGKNLKIDIIYYHDSSVDTHCDQIRCFT